MFISFYLELRSFELQIVSFLPLDSKRFYFEVMLKSGETNSGPCCQTLYFSVVLYYLLF